MNKLVIRIQSLGLGNIFFQYCAASQALKSSGGGQLLLDPDGILGPQLGSIPNDLDQRLMDILHKYNLNCRLLSNSDNVPKLPISKNRRSSKRLNYFLAKFNRRLTVEKEPHAYHQLEKLTFPHRMEGTFINPRYFQKNRDALRKHIKYTSNFSDSAKKIADSIASTNNSVAVHVRRGDYLNKEISRIYQTCAETYFYSAEKYLSKRVPGLKLFIFSDDKNFRFKKWKTNNKKVYVNYLELNTFEDFELMRMCKYHIISNSTFSWWSSFLSESRNSDIILPNRWRNDDLNCEDMYVGDMIRL